MQHPVSAVLLAAGLSKRMGLPKQLLPLRGKPVIRHCLDAVWSAGIRDIVVVLGGWGAAMMTALGKFPARIVFNSIPGSDMAESLRTGLQAVDASSEGILVSLADQPLVSAETIRMLIERYAYGPSDIFVPSYGTRKGHPIVVPKSLLEELFSGCLLRDVIKKYPDRVRLVPVEDEGVIIDIDTMEDYGKVLMRSGDKGLMTCEMDRLRKELRAGL